MKAARVQRCSATSLHALLCAAACALATLSHGAASAQKAAAPNSAAAPDSASTPDSVPDSDSVPEPAPASASAPDSAPDSESAPDSDSPSAAEPDNYPAEKAALTAWAARQRAASLQRDLVAARQVERGTYSWIPWALAGTGVAAMATGVLLGFVPTLSCDDSCSQPFWPAWLIVGGAAAATAGTIWLINLDEDRAEARYRREHLEQELEHERWNLQPVGRIAFSISGRL